MSDLKLYRISGGLAVEMVASASKLEKDLQTIIEDNMLTLFGVRLLKSEYSTGVVHGGRMDSIGVDENRTPVIFEYKRNVSESVINQGLFYLDWLLDHQGDFKVLVLDTLGAEVAATIDFNAPRLICVANDFTRYDEHAIRQMGRANELVRYRQFDELLAMELVGSSTARTTVGQPNQTSHGSKFPSAQKVSTQAQGVLDYYDRAPGVLRALYDELALTCDAMGDDVTRKVLKWYVAFRRLKNFATVEIQPQKQVLRVCVNLDLQDVDLEPGLSRDVSSVGHGGTANLELIVTDRASMAKALLLVQRSYDAN